MPEQARQPLWPGDARALVEGCKTPREELVIRALLETGLKPEELSRLTPERIDSNELTIDPAGNGARIRISRELANLFEQQFRSGPGLEIGLRQIQRIVRAVARRAGIQGTVTPDVLRRTFLSDPLAAGDAPEQTRRILLAAANAAPDIILVANDDRKYVDLNQAAEQALGLPREAVIGHPIEEFFSEAQLQPVVSAWSRFVADGEQAGVCKLRHNDLLFEYRAKANFVPGLHVSVLRPLTPSPRPSS